LHLLEQQDRNQWDCQQTTIAMTFLAQSANGDTISRYHVEVGIAAEHCLSSFSQTRWDKIVASYKFLERIAPSPLHQLNRADLLFRSGQMVLGKKQAELAIKAAPTDSIKQLLYKRLLARRSF